ncbi:tRNA (uridine(54)-C5)-methyltransferase TrmA [Caminibacter mediatlanticus TB-2]|uniref:tRNA (Uridine(54)-C5)-methyltransferase TrmA n=1 Tax=Caminibacter mediatlanticus TB-2 TaxID=391592 RepID=A0ABX5VBT1_9BACT|nr:tRNA (uridine(54)-C5)-methyltransferase TrmA [Caminibacter mediatlanticus]QCT95037.1 tRNA (uridine(54)-C5)-methyltransferase TrmA [Caminibacter mediatlanticus TB-2]
MNCSSFGKCGSCVLWQVPYEEQLKMKKDKLKEMFSKFEIPEIEVIYDKDEHFRARAEFRVWHEGDKTYYAMRKRKEEGRGVIPIEECKIVDKAIYELMPKLMSEIEKNQNLRLKLYEVHFLSNSKGEIIVTLIYHRKVDESIAEDIKRLKDKFKNVDFIVRKKGRKYIFDKNYLIEELEIKGKTYKYKIIENTFTQPNREINKKMISWVLDNTSNLKGDLVELYCGNGNFTIPLSENFKKVVATEINPESIEAATYNAEINNRKNISFLAMSAAEFSELKKTGFFNSYDLKNVLIDPPRAGLDEKSRKFVNEFDNIIYISCNPETLKRDLETLSKNRKIKAFAFFDQFPYTNHMECGVVLERV